jgi:hypothetical protein
MNDDDMSFDFGHNIAVVTNSVALRDAIYQELAGATAEVFKLEQSWMRLGGMLATFKAAECWRALGYVTFDDFMAELKTKYNRGRTVLYGYLSVAEHLLPGISAEKLEEMGISKALELKRAQKKLNGKPLPPALIEAALNTTVTTKELRGDIGRALNLVEEPSGTWFDLDGFFMDKAERDEFKEVFVATEMLLNLSKTTPDHIRRKEVLLAWMREFWGTHAVEVNGPQVGVAN